MNDLHAINCTTLLWDGQLPLSDSDGPSMGAMRSHWLWGRGLMASNHRLLVRGCNISSMQENSNGRTQIFHPLLFQPLISSDDECNVQAFE